MDYRSTYLMKQFKAEKDTYSFYQEILKKVIYQKKTGTNIN